MLITGPAQAKRVNNNKLEILKLHKMCFHKLCFLNV